MEYNPTLAIGIILVVAIFLYFLVFRAKRVVNHNFIEDDLIKNVLTEHVRFYKRLSAEDQNLFTNRVRYFLRRTKISAEKGAIVTVEDKVLIAASATIPLFHFQTWAYENLDEVLLYPDYFDERFDIHDKKRNIAGMVGSGAMNHKMVLSQKALRAGFLKSPQGNTAIHEFVHLIDKADGQVDGVPEYLIPKDLVQPWLEEMHKTIREIRLGKSDIREYAATNQAEFLAVVSEYFFKKPKLLKEDHPELYELLEEIYAGRVHELS